MARSQPSAVWKIVGASAAAIVGGVAIGYLFGGARLPRPAAQPVPAATSTITLPAAPAPSPSQIHPRTANGNYTAPGAPRIVIQEESRPILRRIAPSPAPALDPEATQEAPPKTPLSPAPETTATDTTRISPSGTDSGTPAPTPESSANSGPVTPATPAPTPAAPADPDFERVSPAPKPAPDPESGQQGGSAPKQSGDAGRSQFRVQTGAYTDESNARSVADTLRSQGFSTTTHSERDGDHLVYKVQVGSYRSKNGASKAADDLQKKGYPAYISPIGP